MRRKTEDETRKQMHAEVRNMKRNCRGSGSARGKDRPGRAGSWSYEKRTKRPCCTAGGPRKASEDIEDKKDRDTLKDERRDLSYGRLKANHESPIAVIT